MKILSRSLFSVTLLMLLTIAVPTPSVHADTINDLLGVTPAKVEEEPSTKVITTDDTRVSDRKIRKRLADIFAELETLDKLRIAVNKGVVTLTGEVPSATMQNKANSLAKKVEGVVEVENEIEVTHSVEKRLETTWNKISKLGAEAVTTLPLLLIVLTVLIVAWFVGRWISHRQRLFLYLTNNAFIANLLGQITHLIFIILGLVLALSLLDATALLGTIMGAAGIFGLAIGFAVRDTVENYISSILLSLRNPFQVHDFVDINGNQGSVARLTSRATILMTSEGNHLRIPNSQVFKAVIVNYSRNPQRRFNFDLGIGKNQNLTEAQQIAIDTLKHVKGVLYDPKPMALIQELGDSSVVLRVYGWVNQEDFSFSRVRSEAIKKSKQAFDDAGVSMPDPIYQIRMPDTATSDSSDKPIRAQKVNITKIKEVIDIKPDVTAKEQIEEEFADGDQQNLLSEETPKE